ncbi:MAG: hypothetical protein HY721_09735 [Planctomycetes bacterium]|nr:hypothetical protein [Planctomycetota bacterium]
MLANIPRKLIDSLTVKDLEELLELKKKNTQLADLLRERDRLRLELRRIEDSIAALERLNAQSAVEKEERATPDNAPSFLAGRRKKNLKDYIAQVLLDAGEALSPSEIQRRLPEAGYASSSTNPRSFYNTVFQALQRYEAFEKEGRKYRLKDGAVREDAVVPEILPKEKTRLKDFIIQVLSRAAGPLKVSEIASRVVIEGYETDLSMDELTQRVSATLKKYLNKDFEWDSQRYRLASRN